MKETGSNTKKVIRPALSPEARENQMISLAVNLAEKQLMDGTATSQVITHYLKLGTMKEKLEQQKLEEEIKLQKAKTESIQSQKRLESLYEEAIKSMKEYSGYSSSNDYEYDEH